ncbi:MAG TPA: deoxyguanosinetriphosphate triphosphohydrolase, partial [Erwinia persicina]|nr:deoxyguanosinetriphosphate triphosphohydrolase [Erwinia persicina]
MQWQQLLCSARRKDKEKITTPEADSARHSTRQGRQEIERDYDRLLFSAPTRRLADKTQVFPLDRNDSIRTRL